MNSQTTQTQPITFAIVGGGWRSEFFLRIAKALPQQFQVCGVVCRSEEKRRAVTQQWGVTTYDSLTSLLGDTSNETKPSFLVSSVPWAANPQVVMEAVKLGLPVLSETPPAPTIAEMKDLYADVMSHEGKVQVAEQVWLRPQHQAQAELISAGTIGTVSQVQLSVSHGYHGISLMRKLLSVGFETPRIRALSFSSPIVTGAGRQGPPDQETIHDSSQSLMIFEFDGKLGIIDFTGDQYFGWIRQDRSLIRGERGEIQNNTCRYIKTIQEPIAVDLQRRTGGAEGNLEGLSLQGITAGDKWLYRNPWPQVPLSDDEIAIAHALSRMMHYTQTGEPFYSLADACHDHYLNLLVQEAMNQRCIITPESMPWSSAPAMVT